MIEDFASVSNSLRISSKTSSSVNSSRSFLNYILDSRQLQLVNLGEYHDERHDRKHGSFKESEVLEKGEGMEALLGSVATYAQAT